MNVSERRNSLVTILVCITVVGVGWGLSTPLLGLLLEQKLGASGLVIGLNTAMMAVASLVMTPILPRLIRRFGPKNVLLGHLALAGVSILAFRVFETIPAWFVIRFLFGISLNGLFVATEVWINLITDDRTRGRVFGLYSTGLLSGFTLGMLVLVFMENDSWGPFLTAAGMIAVSILILVALRTASPRLSENAVHKPVFGLMRLAPMAMASVFIYGAIEMGILTLLPVYGERSGVLSVADAKMMMVCASAGGIALQYPIGWLSDAVGRARTLLLCALTGIAMAFAVPLLVDQPLPVFAILFLTGGGVGGLYTIALASVGDTFKGDDIAGGNTAFIMNYSFGALAGPILSGWAMDLWDPHGMMLVLGLMCAGFAAWLAINSPQRLTSRAG